MTTLCATRRVGEIPLRIFSERASERAFLGVCALLFAASAVLTVVWSNSMTSDGRHADAWWLEHVDDVDVSTRPDLARCRSLIPPHVDHDDGRDDASVIGAHVAALPGGCGRNRRTPFGLADGDGRSGVLFSVMLAEAEMRQAMLAHAVPTIAGVTVLIASTFPFTRWKALHLTCCREAPGAVAPYRPIAQRHGDTACGSGFIADNRVGISWQSSSSSE